MFNLLIQFKMEKFSKDLIVNKCLSCIAGDEFTLTEKQFIVTQLMSYLEYLYKGNFIVCNCLLTCLDDYVDVVTYNHHEK